MIIDSRSVPDATIVQADICIIGAGAAGITIAREFNNTNKTVCLIESGGFNVDLETQALYEGENVGWPYWPLESSRLRFFGGTTNHWGGACVPLNDDDFHKKKWIPNSGWPITKSDLLQYYQRAQPIFDLGKYSYNPVDWQFEGHTILPFKDNTIASGMVQHSPPTRFGLKYRKDIEESKNIMTYIFANAVDIKTNESASQVTGINIACLTGNKFSVEAKTYILALGGIENARLLLHANKVQENGLANQHDLVGRYFSDHIYLANLGQLVITDPNLNLNFYKRKVKFNDSLISVYLGISPEAREKNRVLTTRIHIKEAPWIAYSRLKGAAKQKLGLTDAVIKKMGDIFKSTGKKAQDYNQPENARLYTFGAWTENIPRASSRVYLGDERDKLGMRKIKLDWKIGDEEKHSLIKSLQLLGAQIGQSGFGRMRLGLSEKSPWPWRDGMEPGMHHMGSTRMSNDATKGIVDKNCKVHGISNLYIAGSSVFPNYGTANPTLTIVALALRLTDHIKENAL